jgi:hypothetical protein
MASKPKYIGDEDMAWIRHVNIIMGEVNSLTDDIYESLADNDEESISKSCERLTRILESIKDSYGKEECE